MDTGDGVKKTSKNLKLSKDESGPSSKRWMRSDSRKRSDKVGASKGMILVSGGKKSKIDKDEISAEGGAKKRKLSTTTEHDTSPKRSLRSGKKPLDETGQSGTSKMNSNGGEKVEIDNGKGMKRKLSNMEETASKRSESTNRLDETRAEENGGLPIFKLPGELLAKIIDLVPISQWASLESVSRSFQEVVHGLWGQLREIRLDELVYNKEKQPCQVVEAALKKFLIRAPSVASISGFEEFSCGRTSIRLATIRLLSKFEHLQTIDFSTDFFRREVITSKNFAVFLESSASRQSWKRLDIYGGIIYEKMMSHKAVGIKNQPALNLESFTFCAELHLDIFDRFLPIQWSGLKKLVVYSPIASAKEVLSIIRQCTQLSHLEIEVPKFGNGNGQPSYVDFMQGVASLENLSVLKIKGGWSKGDSFRDALLVLIQDLGRRGITDLALKNFSCTDRILDAIINHLPRLKSLDLGVIKCTSASLLRLANGMGQLETLKFRSSYISEAAIIRAFVGNMIDLRYLHLDVPTDVNSDVLTSLGDFRKLKELCINGRFMDCGIIEAWNRLGFGSCLERLALSLRDGISPAVMGGFFKNMPRLRSLDLTGATDDILEVLAKSCPNLAELDLEFGISSSPSGIQSLIDHCSQLKILQIFYHDDWFPSALTVGKYRKITFKYPC